MLIKPPPSISDLTGLYHYEGSLTTPGCNEIVQWLVLDKPLPIRENGLVSICHTSNLNGYLAMNKKSLQLPALRKNCDSYGNPIEDNYRPVQGLNSRNLFHFKAM